MIRHALRARSKQLVTICAILSRIGLQEIKKDVRMIRVKCVQLATDRSCHRHESNRNKIHFLLRFAENGTTNFRGRMLTTIYHGW